MLKQATKSVVKNIIFDLGRVLIEWQPKNIIDDLFQNEQKKPYELIGATESHEHFLYDKGIINRKELIKRLAKTYNQDHIATFYARYTQYLTVLTDGKKIFDTIKKNGYKVFLLTNLSVDAYRHLFSTTSLFQQADGAVVSALVKAAKPEEEIYHKLLSQYNLNPQECFFIDDRTENIQAAQRHGIDGVVYDHHERVMQVLKARGIINEDIA